MILLQKQKTKLIPLLLASLLFGQTHTAKADFGLSALITGGIVIGGIITATSVFQPELDREVKKEDLYDEKFHEYIQNRSKEIEKKALNDKKTLIQHTKQLATIQSAITELNNKEPRLKIHDSKNTYQKIIDETKPLIQKYKSKQVEITAQLDNLRESSQSLIYAKHGIAACTVLTSSYLGYKAYQRYIAPYLTPRVLTFEELCIEKNNIELAINKYSAYALTAPLSKQSILNKKINHLRKKLDDIDSQLKKPRKISKKRKRLFKIGRFIVGTGVTALAAYAGFRAFQYVDQNYLPATKILTPEEQQQINLLTSQKRSFLGQQNKYYNDFKDAQNMIDRLNSLDPNIIDHYNNLKENKEIITSNIKELGKSDDECAKAFKELKEQEKEHLINAGMGVAQALTPRT